MSDRRETPMTDSELAEWIRSHPEVWDYAAPDGPDLDMDQIVDDVLSGAVQRRRRTSTRRRRATVVGVAVGVLALGGTAAALMLRSGQPNAPEAGTLCRVEASLDADAVTVAAGRDPVEGCGQLWAEGRVGALETGGLVPPLVACIDPRGAINVFPGEVAVCAGLGLEPADPTLDTESQSVVALQQRLVDEINLADCESASTVQRQAQAILEESGLNDWTVVVVGDAGSSACAKTGVDTATKTVNVIET